MPGSSNTSHLSEYVSGHSVTDVLGSDLVSSEQRLLFQWVFYSVACELMNVFGTATNIINIICFVKQGLKDAVNISLLGLAISDLGCLITLIWAGICYNPAFSNLELPFEPTEILYLTAGGPHIVFSRVTSCITAFITLERCLCVTMPLKVKTVFTSHRVKAIVVIIFISIFGIFVPGFYGSRIALKFYPHRNKTLFGTVFTENTQIYESIIYAFGGIFLEISAFVTVASCTVILVFKLRDKSKWRQMSTSPGQSDNVSSRDRKVNKMVIVISTLFIVCFLPTCVALATMIIVPELSLVGQYKNLFVCLFSVCFTLESINSATNICIYYHMSSKYKAVLRQLFLLGDK